MAHLHSIQVTPCGKLAAYLKRQGRSVLVTAADLGFNAVPVEAPLLTLREAQVRAEIDCIRRALDSSGGNRCQAARALGISRSTLYELFRRHQLE